MKVTDVEFTAEKLELTPTSVVVVRSQDIDVEVVEAIKEKLGTKTVLGIGPEDDVFAIEVKPTSTVVITTSLEVDSETRAKVADAFKAKTGCKAVVFMSGSSITLSEPATDIQGEPV